MNVLKFIKSRLAEFVEQPGVTPQQIVYQKLLFVKNALDRRGIKCNYDPVQSNNHRVLLYSNRYNTRNYELASECNGLILDYTTWEIVYSPPEMANANYNVRVVSDNFDKYDVYWAENGTVVNLYRYRDRWCISTTRGIDMTDTKWCGIRYEDALTAALESVGSGLNSLNTDRGYTIGFTHPEMHYGGKTHAWFICSWSVSAGRSYRDDTLGLPGQTPAPDFESFEKAHSTVSTSFDTANPVWGLILRSRDVDCTLSSSTVFIESRLMQQVRLLVYDRRLNETAEQLGIEKSRYVFILCILDSVLRDTYCRLYPDQTERVNAALAEITDTVHSVLDPDCHDEPAEYFRARVGRSLEGLTTQQVEDVIVHRDYIPIWNLYL